jgi:hypothetical protein
MAYITYRDNRTGEGKFVSQITKSDRNSGKIIKASGSFFKRGGGQILFCVAHGSSSSQGQGQFIRAYL